VLKFLPKFPEADFLEVDMHSLLGEDEAFSRQTRIAAKNDYNF
jgi:hypothetical protein